VGHQTKKDNKKSKVLVVIGSPEITQFREAKDQRHTHQRHDYYNRTDAEGRLPSKPCICASSKQLTPAEDCRWRMVARGAIHLWR